MKQRAPASGCSRAPVAGNVSRLKGVLMSRAIIALLAAVSVAVMADEIREIRIARFVDLDAPGALETVRREHPKHVVDIQRILLEAPDHSPEVTPGWMRTQFGASASGYGMIFETTDPPRAQFWFLLGDTHYTTLVTLRKVRPEVTLPRNNASPTNSAPHRDGREAPPPGQSSPAPARERER